MLFLFSEGSIKSTAPPFWSSPSNQMKIIQKIGASQNYRDLHQSLSPGQHKCRICTKILCTMQQLNLCSLLLCCLRVLNINFLHTRLSPFHLQQTEVPLTLFTTTTPRNWAPLHQAPILCLSQPPIQKVGAHSCRVTYTEKRLLQVCPHLQENGTVFIYFQISSYFFIIWVSSLHKPWRKKNTLSGTGELYQP